MDYPELPKKDSLITINGVEFWQHREIQFPTGRRGLPLKDYEKREVSYKNNYPYLMWRLKYEPLPEKFKKMFPKKSEDEIKEWEMANLFRHLILTDLWFTLYFVVKPFSDEAGMKQVNSPFIVQKCREIEEGAKDFTLDVWARFHYKTSILTIAETIQYQLGNPENSTGLISYVAPKAKDFLFSIRQILERDILLHKCFPDVLWEDVRMAPRWSLDDGIVLKRKSNRQEPSIGAFGLLEGMKTGFHFERRVYDDIITEDIADSVDMMEKVKTKFDSSQNLGKEGGHHRVVGTFYHHNDPLIYVRDKKNLEDSPKYSFRKAPATIDGTANGEPVLLSRDYLDTLKGDRTFNAQQLCDPTPLEDQELNFEFLQPIERKFIPKNTFKFMIVDQAGDATTNKTQGDAWAMGIFDVEPCSDEIGQSRVFLSDLFVDVMGESEAIEQCVRMYLGGGIIHRLGVEKVSHSATHVHIASALKAKGRHIVFTDDNRQTGILLRPAGRNKRKFIASTLAWPLNNSKLFYSKSIPQKFIDRLKQEMENFPLWHDDVLNIYAYLYDVIKDFTFPSQTYRAPIKYRSFGIV